MVTKYKYEGIITALVTPVIDEEVKIKQLQELIRFVLDNGADGVLVLGGTGEYPALSKKQRIKAVETTVEEVNGKCPVIAGIVAPGLQDAVETGCDYEKIGVDAVMLVSPFYVIPKQEGIMNYYLNFMGKVNLPMILYNIPYRTNVNIEPETVALLLEKTSQIVGIKESGSDFHQISRFIELIGDKISFLCGEEHLMFSELMLGAKGGILATANIFPSVWKSMYLNVKEGNIKKAKDIHFKMMPLLRLIFSETNPGPLKEALKYIGLNCGTSLSPLSKPNSKLISKLENAIDELQIWKDKL